MSSRSRLRSIMAGSAVVALTVSLTFFVSPAQADPKADQPATIADAKTLVQTLNTESAAIDQEYAAAQEKSAASKTKLTQQKADLATQQTKVDRLRDQVASFALATYQRRSASSAAFLGGTDTDFFAKMSTIQQISANQVTELQKFQAEQANLDAMKLAAEAEVTVQTAAESDMASARTRSLGKLDEAKQVLSRLTAEERARIAAEEAREAEQARVAAAAAASAAAEAAQVAAARSAAARTSRDNDRANANANANADANADADADDSADDSADTEAAQAPADNRSDDRADNGDNRETDDSDNASDDNASDDSASDDSDNSGSDSSGDQGDDSSEAASVPVSGRAAAAVAFAKAQVGKPYSMGGTGPGVFDCSGLTGGAWRAAGVELPRTSQQQFGAGRSVSTSSLQPGDLVFYYSGISHVGIYVGGGQIVHAANPRTGVAYTGVNSMPLMGARRPG